MKIKTVIVMTALMMSASFIHADEDKKVCNIKDIKQLASKGISKDLELCKKGDILVFNSGKELRLINISNAMSRVCEISSIKLVTTDFYAPTSGICLYTGKILEVVNY